MACSYGMPSTQKLADWSIPGMLLLVVTQVIADDQSRVEINIYSYFPWFYNPTQINLDYALGKPGGTVKVVDGSYTYTDMFSAMYDAARVALDK